MERPFTRSLALALALLFLPALALADDEIRIAVITNNEAPSGQASVAAAEIAVAEMGGRVLGKPVRILPYDHRSDAALALELAQDAVGRGVHMITDLTRSQAAIAVQEYAVQHGVIVMPTGAGASELHTRFCSPLAFHWGFDSYALAKASTDAMIRRGGDSWFFVTADYPFGLSIESQSKALVEAAGGRVLGASRYPYGAADIASSLTAARASGARVIALASGGPDTEHAIRQAYEHRVVDDERRLATMLMFISEVRRLGLYITAGLRFATPFYWDYDERSRALAERIHERTGVMPGMIHAGTYSAVLNYLKAVEAVGTLEPSSVAETLRTMPVEDAFVRNGRVRADGLLVRDLLLVEVKSAAESRRAWDYYEVLERIDGESAFPPAAPGACPGP